MEVWLFLTILVSFISCLIALPWWIRKCKKIGLVWEDMNKFPRGKHKDVAASGGLIVVMSFVIGVLFYIAIQTFVYGNNFQTTIELFALLSVVLIFAVVGLTDDFLGWKNKGLSPKLRVLLGFVAAIPLMVINAGTSEVLLPLVGSVDLGILYALILVPLAISGAGTTFNFLAGFNGLEAGMGVLVLSFLSYVAYLHSSAWIALVGLIMVASLVVFLFYNWNPAKVFPGDVLTYGVGSLIAGMAILGNFERIALLVYTPFIIEVVLKSRGKLKKSSFGLPEKNGNLKMPYDKIYGLTHFSIWFLHKFKKKVTEKDVVYFIFAIQIVFILLGFLMI